MHVCSVGQPGDEYHLVFECRGLQRIRDRYPGLFGHHAETMIQFMWQADLQWGCQVCHRLSGRIL